MGSHPRSDESLADDPREHRAPDGARSRDGLRGELRGHELHRSARAAHRQAPVRPRVHERARRSHAGGVARALRVGRRGRARRRVAARREGHLQGLPDDARAGGVDREADRRQPLARVLLRRFVGRACSSSGCRTSRCCRASRTSALDEIVAATERGIVIRNRGSWSIDHQRYNFQFSGQVFHEVRGGKITGMLKDVAYQARHAGVLEQHGHDRRGARATGWADRSATARASPASRTRSATAVRRPASAASTSSTRGGSRELRAAVPRSRARVAVARASLALEQGRRVPRRHRRHRRRQATRASRSARSRRRAT